MVMKTIRIGVLGGRRGRSMIRFCRESEYTQLAAVCDKDERILRSLQEGVGEEVPCLSSFEAFLEQDMDAVVLANYATEHAPFAIRCLEAGFHVFSEVLPAQTMREAVELVEAVERTGRVYAYGENYCYMPAPREMRRLYREGVIGEFEYGEGEYVHNCEPIWPVLTGGDPDHWRNGMYATFYCTHSIGPLLHITGLRPVRVTGFEGTKTERKVRCGAKGGSFGMELIELDNGGLLKSLHGDLYRDSVWYCLYGSKGRMESGRADAGGGVSTLYVGADRYSGEYAPVRPKARILTDGLRGKAGDFGHEGSDYYAMHHFVKKYAGAGMRTSSASMKRWICFCPGSSPTARSLGAASRWRSQICVTGRRGSVTGTTPCAPTRRRRGINGSRPFPKGTRTSRAWSIGICGTCGTRGEDGRSPTRPRCKQDLRSK